METEIRVLEIDEDEWISFLKNHGATFVREWVQKGKVYDFEPKKEHKWIRLRTNGVDTTLTIKKILDSSKVDGTKELEIQVSDFEKTAQILEEMGYFPRFFQENKWSWKTIFQVVSRKFCLFFL